jgi:hypothetical protein
MEILKLRNAEQSLAHWLLYKIIFCWMGSPVRDNGISPMMRLIVAWSCDLISLPPEVGGINSLS